MAEEKDEKPWKPSHIQLAPNCALLQATGKPVGKVMLGGEEFQVRCATINDVAWVHETTGKNPLEPGAFNVIRDFPPAKLPILISRALIGDDGKQPAADRIAAMGVGTFPILAEIAVVFLLAGPLST